MSGRPRITTENVADLWEAIFLLQDRLVAVDPDAPRTCRAFGGCGCGAALADVTAGPEAYCRRCVRSRSITDFVPYPQPESAR